MGAKKILVVDFDQEFLKFLSQFLRNEGFAVVTAADGSAGLEMHKSEAPDLVITEAMLPKLHGFELCSRISQGASRKTPVVIVTGVYRDTVYKTEALHTFGASAYFEKPLDPEELMVSLRKILGRPEPKEPNEKTEDLIDAAIMESIVSWPAACLAPVKPAGKSSAEDAIDNMLQSTLAEFGLKPGKKGASVAPPGKLEPPPVKPVSAGWPESALAKPAVPPVKATQTEPAPAVAEKTKAFEPVLAFGGYAETRKRGFPPRLFGAIAGVLVLTSATVFVLKPRNDRVLAEKTVPPAVEEIRTGSDDVPQAVEPAAKTTPVPKAGNKKGPAAAPAARPLPLPNPEDIKPMAPEAAPSLEIKAPETAPSTAGAASVAAGTEAPVVIPAVKVRAGDLIPLEEADVPPRQIRTADPVYPSTARNLRKEGLIMINVLISETGDVIQTAVIGGDRGSLGFDKAAENAVRKWKFSPAEKDGVPVRVWKPVTIGFKLKK
jgi:TonB family protein